MESILSTSVRLLCFISREPLSSVNLVIPVDSLVEMIEFFTMLILNSDESNEL
jgi:hypothetical protein